MRKQIIYIAHPIGGDVEGNLKKLQEIYRAISHNNPEVVPIIPYYATVMSLNDADQDDRKIGMAHNRALFENKVIDKVWLFGDRISTGMALEIAWAYELGIPVVSMSPLTAL